MKTIRNLYAVCFLLFSSFLCADPDSVQSALVIINTDRSQGSGFFLKDGDEYFVVTNAHVIGNTSGLVVRKITGQQINFSRIDLSQTSDLARLLVEKLPPNATAFEKETGNIQINEMIKVYGNSQGRNVVTEISGRVQGVGPSEIEVSAQFVQGNSGSPILNRSGRVIGVATYATREDSRENWVIRGTRFEQVRRFGLRLDDVEWRTVDRRVLHQQVNLLNDIYRYTWDIVDFLPVWIPYYSVDDTRFTTFERNRRNQEMRSRAFAILTRYNAADQRGRYENESWPNAIHKFCDLYLIATSAYWEESLRGVSPQSHQFRVFRREEEQRWAELNEHAARLTSVPIELINNTQWVSGYLKHDANFNLRNLEILKQRMEVIMSGQGWSSKRGSQSLRNRVQAVETLRHLNME